MVLDNDQLININFTLLCLMSPNSGKCMYLLLVGVAMNYMTGTFVVLTLQELLHQDMKI